MTFNTDITTAKGFQDSLRLKEYLQRDSICSACGHPKKFHDERGFCHVCITIFDSTTVDNIDCL